MQEPAAGGAARTSAQPLAQDLEGDSEGLGPLDVGLRGLGPAAAPGPGLLHPTSTRQSLGSSRQERSSA